MIYRSMLESKWGALVGLCFGYVGIALLILIDEFGQRTIPAGERE